MKEAVADHRRRSRAIADTPSLSSRGAKRRGIPASKSRTQQRLITQALAIESLSALKANALAFMARDLIQVGLPHRETHSTSFVRHNGDLTYSINAHPSVGLPYGRYPRLLLIWITTEAVRKKSPVLELGPTLSAFMAQLGLIPAGGRWGTIRRLRDQMTRLFSSTIAFAHDRRAAGEWLESGFRVSKRTHLLWNPANPRQCVSWQSTIELSTDFFEAIVERPVPIDLRAARALRSPFALDIYIWLTYRMSYLRRPTEISWRALAAQFGAEYGQARDFKRAFLRHARAVATVYPAARLTPQRRGLLLQPSPSHVPRSKYV